MPERRHAKRGEKDEKEEKQEENYHQNRLHWLWQAG